MTFQLPKELVTDLATAKDTVEGLVAILTDLAADVRTAADENRGEYDERSERWQEGERGEITSEWLDALDEFADSVDTALEAVSELADRIDTIDEKPNY